jgi:hypothetical protein
MLNNLSDPVVNQADLNCHAGIHGIYEVPIEQSIPLGYRLLSSLHFILCDFLHGGASFPVIMTRVLLRVSSPRRPQLPPSATRRRTHLFDQFP